MADTAAMDVDAQQPQQAQAPAAQQQQQGKDGKKKEAKPSAEDNNNLKDGTVISRYKDASLIVNSILLKLLQEIQPGKRVYDLCLRGDMLLQDALANAFKSHKIQKGAMPTCINVNNFCENFSPTQDDKTELRWEDVVKVELAVHIDGYIASAGHTVILHEKDGEAITGDVANAVCAAYFASELVIRKMKAGMTSNDLSSIVSSVASTFHSTAVEGSVTAAHKKFVLSASPESMTLVPSSHTPTKLEANTVYSVNILFSTDAKANVLKTHPSLNAQLFARDPQSKYGAKLKSAKECLKWIESNASSVFPFSLRALADLPRTRAGLPELTKNGLINPIPVKIVQSGEKNRKDTAKVVGFRTMVLLTETGVERVTGTDFGLPFVKCEYELQGELKQEMARSVKGRIKVSQELLKDKAAPKADVEMKE